MEGSEKMDREEKINHWRTVIENQAESGLSAAAFCREYNFSIHQFHWWRRRFRKRDVQKKETGFLKLYPVSKTQHNGIHIHLKDGIFIDVDPGFDPHTLRAVIMAIRH